MIGVEIHRIHQPPGIVCNPCQLQRLIRPWIVKAAAVVVKVRQHDRVWSKRLPELRIRSTELHVVDVVNRSRRLVRGLILQTGKIVAVAADVSPGIYGQGTVHVFVRTVNDTVILNAARFYNAALLLILIADFGDQSSRMPPHLQVLNRTCRMNSQKRPAHATLAPAVKSLAPVFRFDPKKDETVMSLARVEFLPFGDAFGERS